MQFLDTAKIFLASGAGGDGCISFRRERNVEYGGPNGGNGGKGGDLIFTATQHLNTLIDFRFQQHYKAERGQNGRGRDQAGAAGADLTLLVPVGTQIWDGDVLLADLTEDKQTIILLKGGDGGFGNAHFKTSVNRAPRTASPGYPGQELWVTLRLKLLADIGIVGLPNAGKSTLLSVLTRAHPKIASYPFTTLHPQLGLWHGRERDYVLADLPGLIEDAHKGKGLGQRFLGHAERCRGLLHLIDASQENPLEAYHIVRKELLAYHPQFAEKKELIVLNKVEMLDPQEAQNLKAQFQPLSVFPVFLISALAHIGLKDLQDVLDELA